MKEIFKKLSAMLLAFVMIFGVIAPTVFAVGETTEVNIRKIKLNNTITEKAHKLNKLTEDGLKEVLKVEKVEGLNGVTFTYVKVTDQADFDKIVAAKPTTIEKLNEVKGLDNTNYTEESFGTTEDLNGEAGWVTKTLEDGNYWILEKTRPSSVTEGIAVPFALTLPYQNLEGVNAKGEADSDSHAGTTRMSKIYVYPKNVTKKPQMDKGFEKDKKNIDSKILNNWQNEYGPVLDNYKNKKAIIDSRIGEKVPYEVKTLLKQGQVYTTLSWSDIMTDGLKFNDDILITADGENIVTFTKTILDNNMGFDVTITNADEINKINEKLKNKDVEVILKYTATVTKDAAVDMPESNNITFTPGEPKHKNNNTIQPTEDGGKYKIDVTKTWAEGQAPDNILVTYMLIDKTLKKNVATITLNGANTKVSESMNEGMEIILNNNYGVTFKGLVNGHDYTVEEFADGYDPTYTSANAITNTKNPDRITPAPPQVVTGGKKFVKTDDTATKTRLVGAEFEIKNEKGEYLAFSDNTDLTKLNKKKTELDNAIAEYNKLNETDQKGPKGTEEKGKIATAQEAYNAEYKNAFSAYKWVTEGEKGNSKIVKVISDKDGKFEIKGLAYGAYKLVETKAPSGYALTTTEFPFNVDETSYTTTQDGISYDADGQGTEAQRIQNKKVTIPQTGGIGTVIFVVVGLTIMGGAVVAMKKRNAEEK